MRVIEALGGCGDAREERDLLYQNQLKGWEASRPLRAIFGNGASCGRKDRARSPASAPSHPKLQASLVALVGYRPQAEHSVRCSNNFMRILPCGGRYGGPLRRLLRLLRPQVRYRV